MGANEGKVPYGEVNKLVKSNEEAGCKGVTRSNLYYQLNLWKKDTKPTDQFIGTSVAFSSNTPGAISDLTDSDVIPETPDDVVPETPFEK